MVALCITDDDFRRRGSFKLNNQDSEKKGPNPEVTNRREKSFIVDIFREAEDRNKKVQYSSNSL